MCVCVFVCVLGREIQLLKMPFHKTIIWHGTFPTDNGNITKSLVEVHEIHLHHSVT